MLLQAIKLLHKGPLKAKFISEDHHTPEKQHVRTHRNRSTVYTDRKCGKLSPLGTHGLRKVRHGPPKADNLEPAGQRNVV